MPPRKIHTSVGHQFKLGSSASQPTSLKRSPARMPLFPRGSFAHLSPGPSRGPGAWSPPPAASSVPATILTSKTTAWAPIVPAVRISIFIPRSLRRRTTQVLALCVCALMHTPPACVRWANSCVIPCQQITAARGSPQGDPTARHGAPTAFRYEVGT